MTEEIERVSMEQASEKLSKKSTVENFRDAIESIRNEYFSKWEMSHIGTRVIAKILFFKQVAEILILLTERYPDFFWKTKIAQWHTDDSPVSSREISTILDIIKYGTVEQKWYFMKMMESAKNGNTEDAVELYENHFSWTSIGQAILRHFNDSPLMFSLDKRILKTIDKNKWTEEVKKGSILDIIKNTPQWNRIATGILSNIPQKHLDTFFSLLSEIEEYCSRGDLEVLKRKIDTYTNIDVVYKDQFFTALKLLSPLSIDMDKSFKEKATKNMEFYTEMEWYFWKETGVKEEQKGLLENKDTSLHFTIINDSFPNVKKEVLQEKNRKLERLLNNFIDKGKIIVESGNFKKELLEIFRGSEIGKRLESDTMNPKEMLGYLLTASKEQTEQTKKQLAISDPSFSDKNLDRLHREKPEEYAKLLTLLNGTESTDTKMRALRSYGITTNTSMQPEEQERYIKDILQSVKSEHTGKYIASNLADDKKLELFEQYWTGKMEMAELNAEIEKRDEEIQQTRQEKTNETRMDSAKTYDFNKIKDDFSRIPDNTVLPTKIGDISFTVRKDPNGTATVSYKWLEISGIDAKNSETANDNLNKAAETVRFLEKTGLDIFGSHIPDLLASIKNEQQNNVGETAIKLKDGLSIEEKQIFLRYIGKIIFPKNPETPEKTEDTFSIIEKNGGLLRYLHTNKPEYVQFDDSLNIFAIKEAIKNTA